MKHRWLSGVFVALLFTGVLHAQAGSRTVVFEQPGFPAVDTAKIPPSVLHQAFPDAVFAGAAELAQQLSHARLLVLPYGSAFPEEDWPAIHGFLLGGGDLLTLGGRPFTRPALAENGSWEVSPQTYGFSRELLIADYQPTPGSTEASPTANDEEPVAGIANLRWQQAYSMVIRLSQGETSTRVGASGTLDAELETLLWGVNRGIRRAAPVVQIDHFQNDYTGGRWIMMNCQIDSGFLASPAAPSLFAALGRRAAKGAELLQVTPTYALYLPDEAWQFALEWNRYQQPAVPARAVVTVGQAGHVEATRTVELDIHEYPADETITVPSNGKPGFHTVTVRLFCGGKGCGPYRTGFWIRDEAWLDSGPKVTVNRNYFQVDGHPIEVMGTTYMGRVAQRLYFRYPNPYNWNQDMQQISASGINMLRTGLWTDWNLVAGNSDVATERSLRTIEAYLMTARRYHLPVQFTLFAFMPEVFGGKNAYLDPEAIRREQQFVTSIVTRFHKVPFLMWDLINEPSFDNPQRFFGTHPDGDPIEAAAWTKWLLQRYGSRYGVDEAWRTALPDGPIPTPDDSDMTAQSANNGGWPLSVYDFNLFAQESFAHWAEGMREAIRNAGSEQLITVGQDEGGELSSPSPAFFKPAVDFTTTHSWWFYDNLLWSALAARQSGMPMLVQETGVMPEVNADSVPRRNPVQAAELLERKIGVAFDTGAGAIEWLWDINSLMQSQQEVTIGAVRPDGTEKPEADVLRAYAAFGTKIQSYLRAPEAAPVAVLTSQAEQFSVLGAMATEAQQRAIRVLSYNCHLAVRVVAENHAADIAGSRLTILPSPQMLDDATWQALLDYVRGGGNLLLTGPVDRDAHWELRARLRELGIDATSSSLLYRSTPIRIGSQTLHASFPVEAQRSMETMALADGASFVEKAYGAGHVFVVDAPIELAESPDVTAGVYEEVLSRLKVEPEYQSADVPASVLVRARIFPDAILYLVASESSEDHELDLRDRLSGAEIHVQIPAMRTTMMLVSRATGRTIAVYDPPQWPEE